ncbi:Uncharacterized protein SCF082_LOCUS18980 [Durusdinium trenchii]|uniref:Uncharacterized protein n=1 Tax=Durusdinium trenchii TaxID=1381693 RepID=A0ABP0KTH6_9DINO
MAPFPALFWGVLAMAVPSMALPIEEADKDMLYCNFPMEASRLQSYLNPKLEPELYDGKAWVTAMIFEVASLKLQTPLKVSIPLGGGSELFKLTTNVVRKETGDKGYLLMNLDFPSSAQGWIQKIGCSATQPGVQCGASTAVLDKSSAHITSYDQITFDVDFQVTSEEEDPNFLQYLINRPYKVLQDGPRGVVRMAQQEGKAAAGNYQGYQMKVQSLKSSVFSKRWPSLQVDEDLASARCFWARQLVFVDHDGEEI